MPKVSPPSASAGCPSSAVCSYSFRACISASRNVSASYGFVSQTAPASSPASPVAITTAIPGTRSRATRASSRPFASGRRMSVTSTSTEFVEGRERFPGGLRLAHGVAHFREQIGSNEAHHLVVLDEQEHGLAHAFHSGSLSLERNASCAASCASLGVTSSTRRGPAGA